MKTCPICKQEKSLDRFGVDKSRASGLSYRCKRCASAQALQSIARKKAAHEEALAQSKRTKADARMAQPITANKLTGFYVPARDTFYRNDGLKHIPSKGF